MWKPSSSSSTSLSSSPSSSSNPRLTRTREEVWKDITFALHHSSSRGTILQDFFSKDPLPTSVPSHAFSATPPPPPALLALNSGPDRFGPLHQNQIHSMSHVSAIAAAFDAVVPEDNARNGKELLETDRSSGDRRRKRMIKNRESAARSRARKQAYTNELELEIAHLQEENAKLRKKQEQIYMEAAAYDQKKRPLHRTSSAPF